MQKKLIYPIHHYDEAGRLLPPKLLWLCLVWLSKAWWIWIASLSNFEDRALLVSTFYPHHGDFFLSLGIGFPAVLMLICISWRKKCYDKGWLFSGIKAALPGLLVIDLLINITGLIMAPVNPKTLTNWIVLADFFLLLWVLKSQRLRHALADWMRPDPD